LAQLQKRSISFQLSDGPENAWTGFASRSRVFAEKLTIEAIRSARRTRERWIRFLFVLMTIVNAEEQLWRAPLCLWMDSACGCADSANHIT